MADLKISELTNLTAADPANDMIPIVDVSATPPASGSTKRISINNILACSPSATLASATITGDLTVDTSTLKVDSANNRVGIGTASPTAAFDILGAFGTSTAAAVIRNNSAASASNISQIQFFCANSFGGLEQVASMHGLNPNASANNGGALVFSTSLNGTGTTPAERYRIGNDGTATWSVGGSTAMTLNSTGLGVGGSPTAKLTIFAGADGDVGFFRGGSTRQLQIGTSATAGYLNVDNASGGLELRINGTARAYFDISGNVGIGVTPANWATIKALQVGSGASLFGYTATEATLSGNTYYNAGFKYVANGEASQYQQQIGEHRWYSASNNTLGAGQPITFLERMRLKATGQLRFVPLASDPAGAEAGDVYYNSTSNKLKCYNGTTWNDLF